jgi:acyl-homoserine-lactone acylase
MKNIFILLALITSATSYAQHDYKANVEIVRDSFGVPHIFGKTDADVGYGLGWATCEDDFKTLQWMLLAGKKMAGRNIGKDGAIIDFAVNLLRVRELVDDRYEKDLSPHVREIIEAMTMAVNKYAALHPKEVLVKKAFPASPKDIVSGYVLAESLLSGIDGPLKNIVNGKQPTVAFAEQGKGSNGIAFNSSKTKDGDVYLDINSHQPLEGPLSWYEVHLCSEEGWNVMGGTFHGGVTVFHGVNENLGWAHTVNNFDAVDVFQLQPDPKHKKTNYLFDGVSYKLETRKAWLHVNLAKKGKFILPVAKRIWWSKYGATLVTKRGMFAIRLGATTTVKTIEQYFRMNKARNYTEFRAALDIQGAAMMTTIYGDRFDTIFCISNGLIPMRPAGYDWQNTVPGNTSKTLWTTFHPESDLPQVLNPKSGYIFNFNNSAFDCTAPEDDPKPANYDPTMGYTMTPSSRSIRFNEIIKKYNKVDWKDFLELKYDEGYGKQIHFFKNFPVDDIFELSAAEYPDISDMIRKMELWGSYRLAPVTDTNFAAVYKTFWNLYSDSNDSTTALYNTDVKARHDYFIRSIRKSKSELIKDFGSINIQLGDLQRHQRGSVDIPLGGGPDMIRAAYPQPYKNGRFRVFVGDSYIMLVRFTKKGPEIHTVSPYGASNKPDSPHYTDQMKLYANKQTKLMSLNKAEVYKSAEKIYRPQ